MESSKIRLFIATKSFIRYRGKILILKESLKYEDGSNAGKFDVAGGRIEPGQNFEKSLLCAKVSSSRIGNNIKNED